MDDIKFPKGTIVEHKSGEEFHLKKTGIILVAKTQHEKENIIQHLHKIPKNFSHELALVQTIEDSEKLNVYGERVIVVPENTSYPQMYNIGRQLLPDCEYLLFLSDFENVNEIWLEDRIKPLAYQPIVGMVGKEMQEELDSTTVMALKYWLLQNINLSPEEFLKRCFEEDKFHSMES